MINLYVKQLAKSLFLDPKLSESGSEKPCSISPVSEKSELQIARPNSKMCNSRCHHRMTSAGVSVRMCRWNAAHNHKSEVTHTPTEVMNVSREPRLKPNGLERSFFILHFIVNPFDLTCLALRKLAHNWKRKRKQEQMQTLCLGY